MTEELKDKLLDILIHFKTGLDDIEEGSGERQPMQDEIDFALPLVKKLIIAVVVGQSEQLKCGMNHNEPNCNCDFKHCQEQGW